MTTPRPSTASTQSSMEEVKKVINDAIDANRSFADKLKTNAKVSSLDELLPVAVSLDAIKAFCADVKEIAKDYVVLGANKTIEKAGDSLEAAFKTMEKESSNASSKGQTVAANESVYLALQTIKKAFEVIQNDESFSQQLEELRRDRGSWVQFPAGLCNVM